MHETFVGGSGFGLWYKSFLWSVRKQWLWKYWDFYEDAVAKAYEKFTKFFQLSGRIRSRAQNYDVTFTIFREISGVSQGRGGTITSLYEQHWRNSVKVRFGHPLYNKEAAGEVNIKTRSTITWASLSHEGLFLRIALPTSSFSVITLEPSILMLLLVKSPFHFISLDMEPRTALEWGFYWTVSRTCRSYFSRLFFAQLKLDVSFRRMGQFAKIILL